VRDHEADQIIDMIREHWNIFMSDPTKQMWKAYLIRQDAELTTKAVARLAMEEGDHPTIADLRHMLPTPQSSLRADACLTCGGDRFVVVMTRPAETTDWMRRNGFEAQGEYEEMAPCPDCNETADTSFRRADGSEFIGMDPARVREMLRDV
jgi:hypothetical protein